MEQKVSRGRGFVDERLAKAIAHPLRIEIMVEVERAPMSPREFMLRRGGVLSSVAYHFRELAKCGCLEVVAELPRRGAIEHIYEMTKRALLTDEDFIAMPAPIRGGFTAAIFTTFMDRAREAIEADTMDQRENRHQTWTPVKVDQQGFDRIMEMLGDVYKALGVEELAAAKRMEKSGEETIHATVGMFGFESPAPERDHDVPSKRR